MLMVSQGFGLGGSSLIFDWSISFSVVSFLRTVEMTFEGVLVVFPEKDEGEEVCVVASV